jgi:hypothetical protein
MNKEIETVVLTRDLPEHRLEAGDIGTIVHRYPDGNGFEIEFVSAAGGTVAVLTLKPSDIRPLEGSEILHARRLAS